jgi:hypothetical protein
MKLSLLSENIWDSDEALPDEDTFVGDEESQLSSFIGTLNDSKVFPDTGGS